jgi:hypothetical protein
MKMWMLRFEEEKNNVIKNLGNVFIEAPCFISAISKAQKQGLNPGGSITIARVKKEKNICEKKEVLLNSEEIRSLSNIIQFI